MARTKVFDESEVLEKAVTLFWHKGYNGTSAQDLVEALGISRSSLYDTFGDKRGLFLKALHKYQQRGNAAISMIDKEPDPETAIRRLFQHIVKESMEDELTKGCFMVNTAVELSSHDKEIAAIVAKDANDMEDALCRTIKKGQQEGQFLKTLNARATAHFLFGVISGLRISSRRGTDKKAMEETVKIALTTLK